MPYRSPAGLNTKQNGVVSYAGALRGGHNRGYDRELYNRFMEGNVGDFKPTSID